MIIFHYGKVGLLNPRLEVGSVCIPTSAIDENASGMIYPIPNEFALDPLAAKKLDNLTGSLLYPGRTANTQSVLEQTAQSLSNLQSLGCDFIDMEWLILSGLHLLKSTYPNIHKIKYYFTGIASDKPLEGKTLGDTMYPRNQEQNVAQAQLKILLSS